MSVEVFKLVRRYADDSYCSVVTDEENLRATYKLGKTTTAPVGMLFGFMDIQCIRAFLDLDSIYAVHQECTPFYATLVVLRCQAPKLFHAKYSGITKVPSIRDYCADEQRDVADYFWNEYMRGKDGAFYFDSVPEGTVLVERLTPVEEVLYLSIRSRFI